MSRRDSSHLITGDDSRRLRLTDISFLVWVLLLKAVNELNSQVMVGATAICSIAEQTILLNQASFSDITSLNSYGESAFLPRILRTKIPILKNSIFLSQRPGLGVKRTSRTVVYGVPREPKDSDKGSLHFTDDALLISPEIANSDEAQKKTVYSEPFGTDLQSTVSEQRNLDYLLDKLKAVQLHVLAMEQWNAPTLKMVHRNYSESSRNLVHYLALKSLDASQLKEELSSNGLLNLETLNPHVLSSISACIQMLLSSSSISLLNSKFSAEALPIPPKSMRNQTVELTVNKMTKRASYNRDILLGALRGQNRAHIMVTVGQEVAEYDRLLTDVINSGASIFRINCAHGDPEMWSKIVRKVKRISQMLEKPCKILMDLAGPKLRTGKFRDGPCVVKISAKRNSMGGLLSPATVWLSPSEAGPPPAHLSPDVILHVDGQKLFKKVDVDDLVGFCDARGKHRTLRISSKYPVHAGVGFMAECRETSYVESGTELYIKKKGHKSSVGCVINVPPAEQFIRVKVGDLLTISRDSSNEHDKSTSSDIRTHKISCPSSYLFDSVKPGEPISFDDGKIWGVIKGTSNSEVVVSITHAGLKGSKLGSEKSINIPESDIKYEGLTSKDIKDLDFVAAYADMVGVSFIRDINDIVVLNQELTKRRISKGVVLKIETKGGFENLPLLILEAMKSSNPLGVMIARGDLAVECGWEKLGDIQDEIVSICNAAHVPVILATQVLESLVKSGVPTRAEITDAVYGRRTSCVMLNKGKHIVKAVSVLDTILNSQNTKAKAEVKPLMLSSPVN